ncbi:hypothetical protein STEG23_013287 [Scotinomys teguina]
MAIRTYFSGIFRYLRGKGYSPRSGEIVRAEMQVALSTLPAPTERSPNGRRRSTEESPLPPRRVTSQQTSIRVTRGDHLETTEALELKAAKWSTKAHDLETIQLKIQV